MVAMTAAVVKQHHAASDCLVHPFVSWQDTRAEDWMLRLAVDLLFRTGCVQVLSLAGQSTIWPGEWA